MPEVAYKIDLIKNSEEEYFAPLSYFFYKVGIDKSLGSRQVIGSIERNKEGIQVYIASSETRIDLKTITKLAIYYEGYEGEVYAEALYHRWRLSLGDRNKLKIYLGEEIHEYLFWVRGKEGRRNVIDLLDWCYENKVEVKEYYRGERTFTWKKISYKEHQEIKKKWRDKG